jgi:hypothetical protein
MKTIPTNNLKAISSVKPTDVSRSSKVAINSQVKNNYGFADPKVEGSKSNAGGNTARDTKPLVKPVDSDVRTTRSRSTAKLSSQETKAHETHEVQIVK